MVYKTEIVFRPEIGKFFWAVYITEDELCPKCWKTVDAGTETSYVLASQHAREVMRGASGYVLI